MHSKKKAPVVIFSYNRLWNLKKLLESLKKNYYYDQSKIYIFQDGYNKEMDTREINKIKKTIKFLKGLSKSNKNIYLIIRKKKFGLSKNIIQGVTYVIKKYKKVIVLEDDLILSKNFLNFMNHSLNFYKNNNNIWHISGWSFNLRKKKYQFDNYFMGWPSSWGWATWSDRWMYFEKNPKKLIKWTSSKINKFNFDGNYNFFSQVKRNYLNELNSWAIFWYAVIFTKKKLCVFPNQSLVKNTGYGINSTNTKRKNLLFHTKCNFDKNFYSFNFNKILVENKQYKEEIKNKMRLYKKNICYKFISAILGLFK